MLQFNDLRETSAQLPVASGKSPKYVSHLRLLSVLLAAGFSTSLHADLLLSGSAQADADTALEFSMTGESREDVVGGKIRLGDAEFDITHVSVHKLVGARSTQGDDVRFAVFSSSYSAQTATGQPWVASDKYLLCDNEYNSFLAIYTVDKNAAKALSEPPFLQLTESVDVSDESIVYCFVSSPEKD